MSPTEVRILKAMLLVAAPWLALGACTSSGPSPTRQSQTVYLDSLPRSGRGHHPPTGTTPRTPTSRPLASPAPAAPTLAASPAARPPARRIESNSPEESLPAQRARVQQRISTLDKDESDAVCLRLELISREQIFDRSVQPRRLLQRRATEADTRAELDDIERAINELRR